MTDKFGDRCPCCRTKWKITTFGARVWKDCLECGDTAENLVKKAQKESTSKKYDGADWLVSRPVNSEVAEPFPIDPNWSDYNDIPRIDDDDWDDIPFLVEIKLNSTPDEFKKKLEEITQKQIVFGQAIIKWV